MSTDQKPSSPVVPVRLGLDDEFRFCCRKGIACFNKCCENADVLLTPYDVLRLARRFGLTTREFIDRYTVDAELDPHGTPGLTLTPKPGSTTCAHLTPGGCGVSRIRVPWSLRRTTRAPRAPSRIPYGPSDGQQTRLARGSRVRAERDRRRCACPAYQRKRLGTVKFGSRDSRAASTVEVAANWL